MNNFEEPNETRSYTPPSEDGQQPAQDTNSYFDHTEAYRAQPYYGERPEEVSNTLGVVSFILGLIGCIFCSGCCPPLSIIAIVLAVIDRKKARRFRGMAIAGLVFGILGLLSTLLIAGLFGFTFLITMMEGSNAALILLI